MLGCSRWRVNCAPALKPGLRGFSVAAVARSGVGAGSAMVRALILSAAIAAAATGGPGGGAQAAPGCAGPNSAGSIVAGAPTLQAAAAPRWTFAPSSDPAFDAWRADFAPRAAAQGRDPATIRRLLEGLQPEPRAVEQDQNQAEFVRPPWDYVVRAVSAQRIEAGAAKRREHALLLSQIQSRYGVDADIIAGIWGVETNFGAFPLSHDAPRVLATLAAEGRRRAQFETYLLALIEMVEKGYAGPAELKSSWAGALGQPQFMPDIYLTTAVDWDGDGRRDIWTNVGDVAASIANYLDTRGWAAGGPVLEEARLPAGFDYALADGTKRRVSEWAALGVARVDGAAWSPVLAAQSAELFLPAGHRGPALILFNNFDVIKRYNNSDAYAMSVTLLARALKGAPGLRQPWPTDLGVLPKAEMAELQTLLNRLGYDSGRVDGMFGSATRRAVRQFQQAERLPADGYPTTALLQAARRAAP